MSKYLLSVFLLVFVLSGCSLINTGSSKKVGGVLKSSDAGMTWQLKNKVTEKQTINGIDVLSMTMDPVDTDRIYLGTKDKGIVFSKDGSESWEKMKFPGNKVYGMAINHFKPGNMYASCVMGGRGKVYRTDNYGEEWREVYTEPADGTVITSLAMDKNNPMIVYIGTSDGVIVKTIDGGETWRNLYSAGGAVTEIVFGGGFDSRIYFMVDKKQVMVSDGNGDNFKIIGGKITNEKAKMGEVFSIAVVKNDNGGLYIGTNKGMFRSFDGGDTLEEVDVIASSKEFPIRAIIINPKNSQEIIYSAAQAIYKSENGGKNWSTYQLKTGKLISEILFNPSDVSKVYAGLREFNK
jgi:photosystem II stability/assembly factor-like uncharacterized protein